MRVRHRSVTERRTRGYTLVEIIVVIAAIGVLATLTLPLLRQPGARLYATDVRAQLQQARFEAIEQNIPVAVVYNATLARFETRWNLAATNYNQACLDTGTTVRTYKAVSDYRTVSVSSPTNFGVVWLPSGLGRSCDFPRTLGTITITDGRTTRTVSTSTAGSVTVQ